MKKITISGPITVEQAKQYLFQGYTHVEYYGGT